MIAPVKHLYTLTANLLAETTGHYDSVSGSRTHRALAESFQVGGKGINVAKMAQRLGVFSTAVCFPGGHTGDRCIAWLNTRSFSVQAFRQTGETRGGWVVRVPAGGETTFLGRDRIVEEEPWVAAMHHLAHVLKTGDMLAICGSIPGWRRELADPLGRLLDKFAGDVFVALDTYGAPLADLVQCPIDLVKINSEELKSVLPAGDEERNVSEALVRFRQDRRKVKNWVITGGREPVVGLDEDGRMIQAEPPVVETVSAVGCGDVLLAGLVQAMAVENLPLEEALVRAMPLAAANAASPGIADFDL